VRLLSLRKNYNCQRLLIKRIAISAIAQKTCPQLLN
jgi:hypothetical protein